MSGNPVVSLRELRERRGLSLRGLEGLSGVHRGTLSQIENGRRVPEPKHLWALSEALGVPVGAWRIRVLLEAEAA